MPDPTNGRFDTGRIHDRRRAADRLDAERVLARYLRFREEGRAAGSALRVHEGLQQRPITSP